MQSENKNDLKMIIQQRRIKSFTQLIQLRNQNRLNLIANLLSEKTFDKFDQNGNIVRTRDNSKILYPSKKSSNE
jgi:hypothetical protein